MCKRQVIGPAMFVVGLLYLVVSALLFLVSSDLAGNAEATIAFDGANISSAVWLVLIAILMCPLSITGAYGAREHNKFCLCSFCTLTLVVIFTMWGVAGSLERMSVILDEKGVPISKEDTLRCLTSGLVGGPNITTASTSTASSSSSSNTTTAPVAPPPKIDNTVCTQMSSNAYVGRLRTLWVLLHDTAQDQLHKDSKIWNTFMVKLQKGTINGIPCCGFLRPAHCSGDSGETCSTQIQKNPEHTYYEKTQICNQGYGGCVSSSMGDGHCLFVTDVASFFILMSLFLLLFLCFLCSS